MRRRREHRWVKSHRELTGLVAHSIGRGNYTLYVTYRVTYRQNVTGYTRHEEERSVDLRTILHKMKLDDKEYGLISMLEGGLATFEKIVEQWEWKKRQEEEEEEKKRKETKLARKRAQLVKDRQFGRVLEL